MNQITPIQYVIFSKEDLDCPLLYNRLYEELIELNDRRIIFKVLSFDSYFNMFSIEKWNFYTDVNDISLVISAIGRFRIEILSLDNNDKENLITRKDVDLNVKNKEIIFNLPKFKKGMFFFRILYFDNQPELLYAYWGTKNKPKNFIKISAVICTFKKEKYIQKNLSLLNKLFIKFPLLHTNFSIKIVDNGNTLSSEKLPDCPNLKIYYNENVGGAGGFARGIIETLRSEENNSHILLMDDDIEIRPESILLSISFLSFLKKKYKNYFIGGSMLNIEHKNLQMASVEWFNSKKLTIEGQNCPLDLNIRSNVIKSNNFSSHEKQHQAWWYCIVPIQIFKDNNLPFPLFFKHDDIDFSRRNNARIILLNGICVWHEPFYKKTNIFFDYLHLRNMLVLSATNNYLYEFVILKTIWKKFFNEIRAFNYNGANAYSDIFEHILKGPSFLFNSENCKKILSSVSSRNEKLVDIEEIYEDIQYDILDLLVSSSKFHSNYKKFIWFYTLNGHLLPFKRLNKHLGYGRHDSYEPRNFFLRQKMLVIDLINHKAAFRERSNIKMFNTLKRMLILSFAYLLRRSSLRKQFKSEYKYLISTKFWDIYLNLKKDR